MVEYKSFIALKFLKKPLPNLENTSWIFFSSPRSTKLFFDNYPLPKDLRIAALSQGTAREIKRAVDIDPHFVGDGGKVSDVANDFSKILGDQDHILFPVGATSLHNIQNNLSSNLSYENFEFYETIGCKQDIDFEFIGALFLSSPSQAKQILAPLKSSFNGLLFSFTGATKEFLEKQSLTSIGCNTFERKKLFQTIYAHINLLNQSDE